jgi:hypothetical protein
MELIILKLGEWVNETFIAIALTFAFGILARQGWSLVIKRIAKRGAVITKELSEAFASSSDFLKILDQSIKEDGKISQNSAKELMQAGKEVVAEANDVVLIIKPKKKKKNVSSNL